MSEKNEFVSLADLVRIFRRHLPAAAAAFLLAFAAVWAWYFLSPVSYRAVLTIDIDQERERLPSGYFLGAPYEFAAPYRPMTGKSDSFGGERAVYDYDSYYRLEANKNFARVIVGWLSSPTVAGEILRAADLPPEEFSLRRRQNFFAARAISPQTVRVDFRAASPRQVESLTKHLIASLKVKTFRLRGAALEEDDFVLFFDSPAVEEDRLSWPAQTALAAGVGLLAAFSVVAIAEMFPGAFSVARFRRSRRKKSSTASENSPAEKFSPQDKSEKGD